MSLYLTLTRDISALSDQYNNMALSFIANLEADLLCWTLSTQVRANFIEARYIGLTAMMFGPMMVSWVVAGLTVRTDYQDLVVIIGHLATTAVTSINMLVLVRTHREDAGYRDGYKQARKLQYFSIFPSRLGESQSVNN